MRLTTYSRAASNAAFDAAQAAWDGMSPEEFDPCPRDSEQWAEWCAKLSQSLDVIADWPAYNIQLEASPSTQWPPTCSARPMRN